MEPLRILLVHNAYQQRGGEDAVVDAEEALLLRHGHLVLRYQRHNEEIDEADRLRLVRDTVWAPRTGNDMAKLFAEFRPNVVHAHNTFPLVSPSLYWAAHRAQVPVVQTLHNFRLLCPQAMLMRAGRPCEECIGRIPWPAVAHRCYRGSVAQSAAVSLMLQTHRSIGTWRDKIARYIVLNDFCRERFVKGGLPRDRLRVKPNFLDLPPPLEEQRRGFLFVGRLAPEKGLRVLAAALAQLAAPVGATVIGDGPESVHLPRDASVRTLGRQPSSVVFSEMSRASALVVPSIGPEMFGLVVAEAFANALPVIASRTGALASLVDDGKTGLLFEAGNASDLATKLRWATAHPDELRRMGAAARLEYERRFTGDANHSQLIAIYREAIDASAGGGE